MIRSEIQLSNHFIPIYYYLTYEENKISSYGLRDVVLL